jgi:MFS family permease
MPPSPDTLLPSSALSRALARRGVHYGWAMVGVTFFAMLVTAGAVSAPGVLIEPLQKEFGWTTSDISTSFAVRLALFGLLGPFAAAFMNRFGLKRVAVTALILISLGVLGSFVMKEVWHLILFWGFVVGFGTGLTAMVLGATVATRWFSERRGLVTGLLTAAGATGQLIFPCPPD